MPDTAVHMLIGQDVLSALEEPVRAAILPDPYGIALLGPDPWFVYFNRKEPGNRGSRMHSDRTGAFLLALSRHARDGISREAMFSYLAGFLCHYCLDSVCHPYIISETIGSGTLPGAHRAFEHAMDILEMRRRGLWQGRHPLTSSVMPAMRLPPEMQQDLDAAFREIYGWEGAWRSLRRLYPFFRRLYALMENPKGLATLAGRLTGKSKLRSLAYSESWYAGQDVENRAHLSWANAFDPTIVSSQSLPELYDTAKAQVLAMIRACWRFIYAGDLSEASLSDILGNRSYYSGFPTGDPRNWSIPTMLPESGAASPRE